MSFTDKIISIPMDAINKRAKIDAEYINKLLFLGEINGDIFNIKLSNLIELNKQRAKPTLLKMGATLLKSSVVWAKSGFKIASNELVNERKKICENCEFWDSKAFNGSGRCRKCGCSTWAKLKLKTEKCPVGKWHSST